jgi:general stress protein YciG
LEDASSAVARDGGGELVGEVELDPEHAGELGCPRPAGGCRRARGARSARPWAAIAEVLTGGGEVELDQAGELVASVGGGEDLGAERPDGWTSKRPRCPGLLGGRELGGGARWAAASWSASSRSSPWSTSASTASAAIAELEVLASGGCQAGEVELDQEHAGDLGCRGDDRMRSSTAHDR